MRKIPHNREMILAFANGLKTQTRRTRGLKDINEEPDRWRLDDLDTDPELLNLETGEPFTIKGLIATFEDAEFDIYRNNRYPYGNTGDIVYLGEGIRNEKGYAVYAADGALVMRKGEVVPWKWKTNHISSVYMPEFAARYYAKIVNVRVERLQSISRQDCIAEGIDKLDSVSYRDYLTPELIHHDPINSYYSLWKSINGGKNWSKGQKSWDKNPWLWVTEYEPVTWLNPEVTGKKEVLCQQ